jgi:hypothetical protein
VFVIIVAGSRSFGDRSLMYNKLDYYLQKQDKVLVVHGGANGADKCASMYAKDRNIETKVFLPDWNKHGKKAGILRNIEMFEYASKFQNRGCVVFWDGTSKGTKNDIELSEKYNVPLRIVEFR